MKVLFLAGSERPGNTDGVALFAAELFQQKGHQTEIIALRDRIISPCGLCGDCNTRSLPCQVEDDVAAIVKKMVEADAIIYCVPVHAFGMASVMQVFIERAGVGYLRFERPLAMKVGGCIVVERRYSGSAVFSQLLSNLYLNRMIIPGSGYPPIVRGGSPGDWQSDREGLSSVQMLVEAVCRFFDHRASGSYEPSLAVNERVATDLALGNGPT